MKMQMLAGSTSQIINVYIRSTSSINGGGLTGLVYNSTGLIAYYALPGAASVQIPLVTQTVTGAWSSGGFKEIDPVGMPGWYRLDIPNAVIASGRFVDIHIQGAANMVPCPVEMELTAINNQSTGFGLVNASANIVQVNGSASAASNIGVSAATSQTGQAATGTLSSTIFTTNLASTTTSEYNNRVCRFTSGALAGQERVISAYSATGQITVSSAYTTAPSNTDPFIII